MNLNNIMNEKCISFDISLKTKEEVFDYMINQLYEYGAIKSKEKFLNAVLYRESLSETGLSEGIAIPHGKDDSVIKEAIGYVRLKEAIEWESLDDKPVKHIFLLAIPNKEGDDIRIRMMSQLARSLLKNEVIERINNAKVADDLLKIL